MEKTNNKRVQISQAQSRIMLIVSIATVITVFCLVSSKALVSQAAYQKRLVSARESSVKQLQANKSASLTLIDQYNNVFQNTSTATNIIGGKFDTNAAALPPNQDNARIVLNALPTSYDFAGLISSVAKILSDNGISSQSITGTDESATATTSASATPQPVEIKLTIGGQGSYDSIQKVVKDLERSIRPFDIRTIQLNGTNSTMTFTAEISTYYQPAKTLETTKKKVQ